MRSSARPPAAGAPPRAAQRMVSTVASEGSRSWDPWPAKEAEAKARPPAAGAPSPRVVQRTVSTVAPERHPVEGSRSWDAWPAKETEATARLPSADYFSEVKTQEHGEKIKKYQGMLAARLMAKYFSTKTFEKGYLFEEFVIESEIIRLSRYPFTSLFADPVKFCREKITRSQLAPEHDQATYVCPSLAQIIDTVVAVKEQAVACETSPTSTEELENTRKESIEEALLADLEQSQRMKRELLKEKEACMLAVTQKCNDIDSVKALHAERKEKQVEELNQKNEQLIQTIDQVTKSSEGQTEGEAGEVDMEEDMEQGEADQVDMEEGEADEVDMEEDTGRCYMLQIGGFNIAILLDDD